MEVLNAAGLAPISLPKPFDKRHDSRKPPFPFKFPKFPTSSGGLALLSSILSSNGGGSAGALTYEEALQQSVSSSPDFEVGAFVDSITKFGSENPLVVGGGAVALAVAVVLSLVFKENKRYGIESAKSAYAKLSEDGDAQLLDIREGKEFREIGSPDVRSLKKKAVAIAYRGDDKQGFLKKLASRFKEPGNTTLFILDKFDGNSEFVAELATANGFKAAFAIKNGAEGPRGWMRSGLPWSPPKNRINVDFGDLKDAIDDALGGDTDGLPVALGLAAATGLSLFAFSEIETALQLVGSAAIVQFIAKKLLFAEDRKVTLQQIDEFLNTKVAPKELADEMKMIGKALLPVSANETATAPAPEVENPGTSVSAETTMVINSEESLPKQSRPLSPYPFYPDLKPPTSPCPSQP